MPLGDLNRLKQRVIDDLRRACRAKLVNWCLQLSTHQARKGLTTSNPLKVLVDNSVLGFGRTHETVQIVQETHWPPGSEPGEILVADGAPIDIKQKYGKKTKQSGDLDLDAYEDTLPIRLTPMTATCRVPPLSRVKLGIGWSRGVARDAEQ